MSLHVTLTCDRCGIKESTPPAGKPLVATTILPFTTKGLPDDQAADLCRPCAVIVQAGIARVLRQSGPADLLKLE